MTRIDKLFVLWVPKRRRHVIGVLSRSATEFSFRYLDDLSTAQSEGFEGLVGFPLRTQEFRSPHLFAAFSHRVPSPARPDFSALMDEWGVEDRDDPFEILARSGGLQVMDRLELAEYRPPEDRLDTPLAFRVAGQGYAADPSASAIRVGDPVELRLDPANEFDPAAVMVASRDDRPIGYVPRQYAGIISSVMSTGQRVLARATRRLLVPGEGYRWVIQARRA